jgi:hypothetical protein
MAYPGENEHKEYMDYLIEWSEGAGPYKDRPKMNKEEWRKARKKGTDTAKNDSILGD